MRLSDAGPSPEEEAEEDSYFGADPRALDPSDAPVGGEPARVRPRRPRRRPPAEDEPTAPAPNNHANAAGTAVLTVPAAIASLLAIPRLRGYDAAALGLAALTHLYLPLGTWYAKPGARNTRRQRFVLSAVSSVLALGSVAAGLHVDGLIRIGVLLGALYLGSIALVLHIEPTNAGSEGAPPTKAFRPLVVLTTLVVLVAGSFGVLYLLAILMG